MPNPFRSSSGDSRAAIAGKLVPAVLVAALVWAAPAGARDKKPKVQDEVPPFEIVLESEQLDYTVEDPVTLNATVYNNTDQNAIVDVGQLGAHGKYDLLALDSEEVLESGSWEPEKGLEPHKVPLRAHASVTRFVSLTKELGALLRDEGRIRVSLEFCDTAFGGDSAKPRCVGSNAIILRINREAGGQPVRRR